MLIPVNLVDIRKFAWSRGYEVYKRLKYEAGTHRVQRVPQTETQGRVHTSAATVAVLAEAEEIDVEIKNEDLRIDTYRSGLEANMLIPQIQP